MQKKSLLVVGVLIVLGAILFLLFSTKGGTKVDPSTISPEVNTVAYTDAAFTIKFEYPEDWVVVPGDPSRYLGESGFVNINGIGGDKLTIDQVADAEAHRADKPYGSTPTIEKTIIDGQEARLIFPSKDQADHLGTQSALIALYPTPVSIKGATYNYLLMDGDKLNLRGVASSIDFIRGTSSATTATTSPAQTNAGILVGHMNLIPLCPKVGPEQNPDCQPTADVYAGYKIGVYKKGSTVKVAQLPVDNRGNFMIGLEPGTYSIMREVGATAIKSTLPKDVTIVTGKTAVLTFDVNR